MKFALFLCLVFAIAVEYIWAGGELKNLLEDEIDVKGKCKDDGECEKGECCLKKIQECIPKKEEGDLCSATSKCFLRCHDDLKCEKDDKGVHRCSEPKGPTPETEGSGSGEMDSPAV